MQTKIFTLLDEERKVMSFAMSELIFSAGMGVVGFAFHALIIAIIGMFGGVFIMRYIKAKLKKTGFSRKVFFVLSDFLASKKAKYYGKYYL